QFENDCLKYFRELDLPSIIKNGEQEQKRAKLQQEINASDGRKVRIEKKIKDARELLGGGTPIQILRKTFEELQQEWDAEEATGEKLKRELASSATQTVDYREFQDIIGKLQSTNGDDIYRLRATVASRLKTVATKIVVAAAGSAPCKNIKAWCVVGEK